MVVIYDRSWALGANRWSLRLLCFLSGRQYNWLVSGNHTNFRFSLCSPLRCRQRYLSTRLESVFPWEWLLPVWSIFSITTWFTYLRYTSLRSVKLAGHCVYQPSSIGRYCKRKLQWRLPFLQHRPKHRPPPIGLWCSNAWNTFDRIPASTAPRFLYLWNNVDSSSSTGFNSCRWRKLAESTQAITTI